MNKIFSVMLAAAAFAGTLSAGNSEGNLLKNGDFKHGFFHEAIPVKSAGNAVTSAIRGRIRAYTLPNC